MKFKCISNKTTTCFGKEKTIPHITVGRIYFGSIADSSYAPYIIFYNNKKQWDVIEQNDIDCFEPVED